MLGEVDGNRKRLRWFESIDAGFLVWGVAEPLVELAVTVIGLVQGLKWYKLRGIRCKVGCMLLYLLTWVGCKFKLV
jgi:hypothetical protein